MFCITTLCLNVFSLGNIRKYSHTSLFFFVTHQNKYGISVVCISIDDVIYISFNALKILFQNMFPIL